jgi:hypothetical protein
VEDATTMVVHSRVRRSFGGKEPINFTLVNQNVLGPPGWLPMASGITIDLILRLSGYTALGPFEVYCI